MKNHEKIHTKLTCMDCGEEFEGKHEEKSKNNRPSRCPECDKKLRQKNTSVCDFYRAGHCMFGPKGQNKKGKCYKKHPEPCEKFSDGGCEDKNCSFMHPAPVCTFYLKKKCDRKHCKFTHKRPEKETATQDLSKEDKRAEKSHSDAQNADRHSKNGVQTFLDHLTTHTKRLEELYLSTQKRLDQMEEKMGKNNNIWPPNTAFPQMWPSGQMQQIPQSNLPPQAFQQRIV